MNAPSPVFTSSRMACAPAASFLHMIDEAIKGMDCTVPVTSRRAYSFPSAGARSRDWPVRTIPFSFSWCLNSSVVRSTRYPGMASNLSSVPPLKPSPRPDILPTGNPLAATMGRTARLVLSPTPPEECLSTARSTTSLRSSM